MTDLVQYINPPGTAPAQGNYSHATRVKSGDLYYISGQLSVDGDGNVVGKGDFEAQFKQVFSNMKDVLKGLGIGFDHIVKFNTYFVHSQDIDAFMRLRREHFKTFFRTEKYPPNTIAVIDRLVKEDFLFEVEAVARAAD
ncbi:MAG: RidA family protein [Pseudolabrys sp.]|jgi:enamine deaminase RidA (YjgF/YER057c/UK114 family)